MRWWRHLVCLGFLAGCAPGGGGGGGDCREADEACSEGARCVAVGGVGYACRATCGGDGDCLRDERCEGGLCLDRAGPTLDGAVVEGDAAVVDPPAPDVEVDGPLVRVVDEGFEPPEPDVGVVVLPPFDAGFDPGACAGRFDASGDWLLGVALGFAPGSPLFFRAEVTVSGGSMGMRLIPLRARDRAPVVGEETEIEGVAIDGEGRFRTGPIALVAPAEANRLGGDVVLELALDGALRPPGAICGVGGGVTVQPPGRALDGTVFAFAPWREPIAGLDPFAACEGCLP